MPSIRKKRGLAALALFALATSASAHHGWNWAEEEQSELSGTIESLSFAPPHPSLTVDVDGEVWQVDLGNPNQTQQSGFAEESAQVGDEVTILGNRSLDASEMLMKAVRLTVNGENYDMYPERIQGD